MALVDDRVAATLELWAPASAGSKQPWLQLPQRVPTCVWGALLLCFPLKPHFCLEKSLSRNLPPRAGGCLFMTTWGVQTSQKSCQDLVLGGENTWAVVVPCPEERWHFGGKGDILVVLLLSSEHLLSTGKINKCEQYFGLHKSSCYSLLSGVSSEEWLLSSRGGRWSLRAACVCELHVTSSDGRQP